MNQLLSYLKNPIYCDNQKPRAFYLLFLVMVYIISIIPFALIILVTDVSHKPKGLKILKKM